MAESLSKSGAWPPQSPKQIPAADNKFSKIFQLMVAFIYIMVYNIKHILNYIKE
jgi:hypothetical protein